MNKSHELKTLEVEIHQAQMNQQIISGQANMRASRLEGYRQTIRLLMNDAEKIDEQVIKSICEQMRRKIEELDI